MGIHTLTKQKNGYRNILKEKATSSMQNKTVTYHNFLAQNRAASKPTRGYLWNGGHQHRQFRLILLTAEESRRLSTFSGDVRSLNLTDQ